MSRYSDAYADPHAAGDARPTTLTIVKDEDLISKVTDKVMLIIGGSTDIDPETARAFHATGAKLFPTVRDLEKGQKIVDSILSDDTSNRAEVILIKIELDSLVSVHAGAQEVLSRTDRPNVLVNNAGVMATPEGRTKDGFETQFGINHLAHFFLFQMLKSALLKSSTLAFQSRVVCVSSTGHRYSTVYDDYNFDKPSSYDPWNAYGPSKTGSIYLANEIQRRYSLHGLHATSRHPGFIQSGLQVHSGESAGSLFEVPEIKAGEQSTAQGAATTVHAAMSRDWEGKGGMYLSNCAVICPFRKQPPKSVHHDDVIDDCYLPHAYDAACEGRPWKDSLKVMGLKDDG